MARAHPVTPLLELRESTQSGDKLMTGAYVVQYTEDDVGAFIFGGAHIDLTNMAAGDVVDVRVRYQLSSDGSMVNEDLFTYNGAAPAAQRIAQVGVTSIVYGIEVAMRQTAGALRTLRCQFFDAKKRG